MATRTKALPANGSDTDHLKRLLKSPRVWRLLFWVVAGAMYETDACAELGIDRTTFGLLHDAAFAARRGEKARTERVA